MSDEQNPGVDPRFDPAFQRGFDPATPIEEYAPPLAPRPAAVRPSVLATPAKADPFTSPASPAPAPLPSPPPTAATVSTAAEAMHPDVTGPAISQADAPVAVGTLGFDEPSVVSSDEASAARNPFLIALAVIAVIFVVGGVWLFVRSGDAFDSKEVRSQGDFMSLTAAVDAAPFIALLGAATAIGVIFFFAARYRHRR